MAVNMGSAGSSAQRCRSTRQQPCSQLSNTPPASITTKQNCPPPRLTHIRQYCPPASPIDLVRRVLCVVNPLPPITYSPTVNTHPPQKPHLHHEVGAAPQLSPDAAVVAHNQALSSARRVVGPVVPPHHCIGRWGDVDPGVSSNTQQVDVNTGALQAGRCSQRGSGCDGGGWWVGVGGWLMVKVGVGLMVRVGVGGPGWWAW